MGIHAQWSHGIERSGLQSESAGFLWVRPGANPTNTTMTKGTRMSIYNQSGLHWRDEKGQLQPYATARRLLPLFFALPILAQCQSLPAIGADTDAHPGVSRSAKNGSITKSDLLDSRFPLPNLSSGYTMIQLKDGKNEANSAGIMQYAIGSLDEQPAAVVYIAWSTGGSGIWEVLGLYRLVKGVATCIGVYGLEDRSTVKSLKIQANRVVLDWVKHGPDDPAPMPPVQEVLKLKSSQFQMP